MGTYISLEDKIMDNYFKRGFAPALPLLSPEELAYFYDKATYWDNKLGFMSSDYRCKSNILFKWVHELASHPKLLEYITAAIGPNFDCWDTMLWFKKPGEQKGVTPHQDGIYWNWYPRNGVSVWVALTPLTIKDNSPILFYDKSHEQGLQPHDDITAPGNMLMRNQTVRNISGEPFESEMDAGTVTLFHPNTIHGGAGPSPVGNKAERIGVEIIYIANDAKPILNHGIESSIRMCGKPNPNIFYDPAPEEDFGELEQKFWRRAYDNQHANYYSMTNEIAFGAK